jgi:hypothetical protein
MECLSHTITHMGEHLSTQLLIRFKQDICALIKDSHLASNYFFDVVGHHFTSWEYTMVVSLRAIL